MRQLIKLLSFSAFIAIWSCGRCPDDTIENFVLTDDEKSLIGFDTKQVIFVDETNQEFVAEYSLKQNLTTNTQISDDEDCFPLNVESLFIFMSFTSEFQEFNVSLRKNALNETSFLILYGNETISLQTCEGYITTIPERKSIDVNGFEFTNVLDLTNCLASGEVSRIIYSPDIGIKYIGFSNETFLRLKE